MAYAKAHPFGYKPTKDFTGKPSATPQNKKVKQTVVMETEYKVMRRKKVWEKDPITGKMKMKLVPVTETVKTKLGKTNCMMIMLRLGEIALRIMMRSKKMLIPLRVC